MVRVLATLLTVFVLSINISVAYAVNLNKMTSNPKIMEALKVLEAYNSYDVLNNLEQGKVKIIFYDLKLMSFSYDKYYAIASVDNLGENYILINADLRNSSKEALACLIAHESMHKLAKPTLQEETLATMVEAQHWIKIKNNMTEIKEDRLTSRLNRLENLYLASNSGNNLIQTSIQNNAKYRAQLAMNN